MKSIYSLLAILISVTLPASAQTNIWVKAVASTDASYSAKSATDADGNIYTTGTFIGSVDFDPGPGTTTLTNNFEDQVFIQKLDASGNFVWAQALSGGFGNVGSAIAIDPSGNILLTGLFRGTVDFDTGPNVTNIISSQVGKPDAYVAKLNSSGALQWVKTVGAPYGYGNFVYLAVDDEGSAYSSTVYEGVVDLDPGPQTHNVACSGLFDAYVQKLNSNGEYEWGYTTGAGFTAAPAGIAVDSQHHTYVTGNFWGTMPFGTGPAFTPGESKGNGDVFIQKLDDTGYPVLAKQIGGVGLDDVHDITISASNEVFLAGFFTQTADFNIGGTPSTRTAKGELDAFVARMNSDLSLIGTHQIGGTEQARAEQITIGPDGSIYVSGSVVAPTDFNVGGTPFPYGKSGGFVMRMDNDWTVLWVVTMSRPDRLIAIGNETLLVTGAVFGNYDFDPGPGILHAPIDGIGIYQWELDVTPVAVTGLVDPGKLTLYPNPCRDFAYLTMEGSPGSKQLTITDFSGRPVRQLEFDEPKTAIDVNDLNAGIYIVNVLESDGQSHRIKLIRN